LPQCGSEIPDGDRRAFCFFTRQRAYTGAWNARPVYRCSGTIGSVSQARLTLESLSDRIPLPIFQGGHTVLDTS